MNTEHIILPDGAYALVCRVRGEKQAQRLAAEKGCRWTYMPFRGFLVVARIGPGGLPQMNQKETAQ